MLSDVVYSIGVDLPPYKEMWNWDVLREWFRCADMIAGRRYHCVTSVNSTLYVLGGRAEDDYTTLSSVESYNTKTNKWSSVGHLIHSINAAAHSINAAAHSINAAAHSINAAACVT